MQLQQVIQSISAFNAADWALVLVLLLSILMGLYRGLVYEVLSVLGWVAAFFAAQWLAPQAAVLWKSTAVTEPVRHAIVFILIFIVTAFVSGLLAKVIRKMVSAIGLRMVDATLGGAFGLMRGFILVLVAAAAINMTSYKKSEWWQKSASAPVLNMAMQDLKPMLPSKVGKYFDE